MLRTQPSALAGLASFRGRSPTTIVAALFALVVAGGLLGGRAAHAQAATKRDLARLQAQLNKHAAILRQLGDLNEQFSASLSAITTDDAKSSRGREPRERATRTTRTAVATPRETPGSSEGGTAGKGTVVGKVSVRSGSPGDVWIYVEDIAAPAAKATATMTQVDKQFSPRVLVVQKGTKVAFPNGDPIFHNVFSLTPGSPFDLGSYPKGESREVTMARPGVVSVYCNMHSQMVGHILVAPNALFTRAGKDGFYRLANVPAGKHRLAAWTPHGKTVVQEVDVPSAGVVTVEIALSKGRARPHKDKDGKAYQSYEQ